MSIKTSKKVLPDLPKLEPLDGTNYCVTTLAPSDSESSTGPSTTAADQVKKDQVIDPEKYAKDNKTVHRHLLNHMLDPMFDLFVA
ncbi:ty1-copia retrotransposon protein [Cucumis melo var. makuwa]|uniref:Ty1-copia retrotransposon protein n=1 Tax=Cucumis melo var. makuwa TaxID=1194695 RepID=A0A5A7V425_CUCMM|nr:ty1-copia retrotransposon protein [Cucumis melo var. makuwa]